MDIFEELGLHRYINAQDTFTTYGASCMPAASLRAMREIASSCVELAEVQAKTGDALAKLTHNEGAYISNGAAGGMMVATAAALARDDEKIFHSLPEITGPRYEVVMQAAQRNMYDRGCSAVGAKMRYIGTADTAPTVEELEAAITPATAAVFYVIFFGRDASLPLETMVEVAHRHGVPVIVDAAARRKPLEVYRHGGRPGYFQRRQNHARPAGFRFDRGKKGMDRPLPPLGSPHGWRLPRVQDLARINRWVVQSRAALSPAGRSHPDAHPEPPLRRF